MGFFFMAYCLRYNVSRLSFLITFKVIWVTFATLSCLIHLGDETSRTLWTIPSTVLNNIFCVPFPFPPLWNVQYVKHLKRNGMKWEARRYIVIEIFHISCERSNGKSAFYFRTIDCRKLAPCFFCLSPGWLCENDASHVWHFLSAFEEWARDCCHVYIGPMLKDGAKKIPI